MIPSLVVDDIRTSLIEYLASTFALSDDDVRDALSEFLTDQADGIFRGPYLRVRTPFKEVEAGWQSPLDFLPEWFVPYAHQAKAFERLGSRDSAPQPTLVTTGTGSGKTECFLMPILDHCTRARARGELGVKALILYPMNALASDQAGRIADLIHTQSDLAGVTAGLYVGGDGRHTTMGPDHLIDTRHALRADPPDILLTNYKMLDFLLLREEDRDLWAANGPDTLHYVVLDEFHTYDGAQGTDVAMLLRRLGATLKMAAPGGPLGNVAPVATSATLASGDGGMEALRTFAGKVFGVDFDADSVVGEQRTSVEEACGPIDFYLTIPSVPDVLEADELDTVAAAFCTSDDPDVVDRSPPVDDVVALGERLLAHPLTRAILAAVGDRPRTWRDAVAEIVSRVPDWGRVSMTDPGAVEQALGRYLWLLSVARRRQGERLRPLFGIEVQLWVREVSRLLRTVAPEPGFRWHDSGIPEPDVDDDGIRPAPQLALPGAYCRRCGMSGWIALAAPLGGGLITSPAQVYQAVANRAPTVRALIRTGVDDPATMWLDPVARRLAASPDDGAVPVLVNLDDDAAKANRCPACDERDAIRFIGLRVASLTSVSINTLFSSEHLEADERKLLAFTDSVQDASHRASFFAGRTHRINLRSLMAGVVETAGTVTLADLGDELTYSATNPADRFQLVPPDLLRHQLVRTVWTDDPIDEGLELLRSRLGFEADIEFGLRSRVGRTLELCHVAAAEVAIDEEAIELAAEDIVTLLGEVPPQAAEHLESWVRGMLERLRLRGAIVHPLLQKYIDNAGKLWFVWGGRPDGLPPFTPDQGRPTFATTASTSKDLDALAALGANPTWWIDWTTKVLGVEPKIARDLNVRLFPLLASGTDLVVRSNAGAAAVFGLDRRAIVVHDLHDATAPGGVRCDACGHRHAVPHDRVEIVAGTACLRYRCGGRYEVDPPRPTNYYRRLYRRGITRRVVTGEHTGLLRRHDRELLELAFKDGTAPDAPNVLTATPTLEMGIDIGDLSAVMLTSVPRNPAAYVQRVGRAGRASGNALITTFVPTDSHGLYYLAEPEAMIAGDIRPPDCYLDAVDTLARQYVAYLFDRAADGAIAAPTMPRRIVDLFRNGLDEGGLLRALIDASELDHGIAAGFLALFDGHLEATTVDAITELAAVGVETRLKDAVERFGGEEKDLSQRIKRLSGAIEKAELGGADDEISALRGQRAIIQRTLQNKRDEYTITALERLGVLPNYTLLDNGVTLEAAMWSRTPEGGFDTEIVEYSRPGGLAIREFAPGNSFYAGGHRHVVDAIDIGTVDEPLHQEWRLCPECGFGRPEADENLGHCPRCGAIGFADVSAQHTLVRLSTAYASGSEEAARVYDENDDRQRERYDLAHTVDIDTTHVDHAWRLTDRIFGAELARHAVLRTINLGFVERRGETRPIAGRERHITRFTACAHCGTVRETRAAGEDKPESLHRGWCKVRSGAVAQKWTQLVLFHELVTDAIRVLLPVSMFEIDERLASFKGALLLGLREDFGGDPDHLRVVTADLPNRAGMGRRNFLILYDAVPGGTGYLDRLADPDRMRTILESARRVISLCRCRTEGRSACHRCLLGVVDRNEYDLVSRSLALSLLDSLLDDWDAESVPSVADIDIGLVEESELERRFKVALNDWAGRPEAADWLGVDDVSLKPLPGKGGYDAFELRIKRGDQVLRYRVDEQEGLSTTPNTQPDFLIRRLDDTAPDIAVYLDGFQFHASAEHNNLADDVAKRNGVRQSGRLVWNLTWNDVETFHKAVAKEYFSGVPKLPLLSGAGKTAAKAQHAQLGASLDFDTVDANPVELLLRRLATPDGGTWRSLALSACAGAAFGGDRAMVDVDGLRESLVAGLAGSTASVPDVADPVAIVSTAMSQQGQSLFLALRTADPDAARWTAVAALADDTASVHAEAHRRRWQDWLQWANILQFLRTDGRDAVITTTSAGPGVDLGTLWVGSLFGDAAGDGASTTTGDEAVPLSDEMDDELDLVIDDAVRPLIRAALQAGAPDFVAGHELDGVPLEAAWPDRHVAVVPDDAEFGAVDGWTIHRVGGVSLADLLADLETN